MENSITCCVVECSNEAHTTDRQYFGFPIDFNLCMLWVETIGNPKLFEEFAFGGALPFLNKTVCSYHFENKDFIDPNNKSLGILPGTIPKVLSAIDDSELKKQNREEVRTNELLGQIKPNKQQVDGYYRVAENSSSYSTRDSCNLLVLQKIEYDEELGLSNDPFDGYKKAKQNTKRSKNEPNHVRKERLKKNAEYARRTRARESEEKANMRRMKNAVRAAFRRENETPYEREERRRQNMMRARIRRQTENEDEKLMRRSEAAARASYRRKEETEEQTNIRRMKNALRAAMKRQNESPEETEERRRKNKLRARIRRKSESSSETNIRRYNDAVRAALKRNGETREEREARRQRDSLRAADRRKDETPEQREQRLDRDKQRVRKKRTLKKMFERIHGLGDADELPVFMPVKVEAEGDPLSTSSFASLLGECSRSNMEMVPENSREPMTQFPDPIVPEVSVKVECLGNRCENAVSDYWNPSTLAYPNGNITNDFSAFSRNSHFPNIADEHSMRNFLQL